MNKFIYVQDKEEAEKLLNLNYHLVQIKDNIYIFENNNAITFELNKPYISGNVLMF